MTNIYKYYNYKARFDSIPSVALISLILTYVLFLILCVCWLIWDLKWFIFRGRESPVDPLLPQKIF